jgi:hypothetical protein
MGPLIIHMRKTCRFCRQHDEQHEFMADLLAYVCPSVPEHVGIIGIRGFNLDVPAMKAPVANAGAPPLNRQTAQRATRNAVRRSEALQRWAAGEPPPKPPTLANLKISTSPRVTPEAMKLEIEGKCPEIEIEPHRPTHDWYAFGDAFAPW